MSSIQAYLSFNGNCREAMQFYQQCFGGELHFQTVGDSPLSKKMPPKMKNCILHSMLSNQKLVLLGSDIVGGNGLIKGNAVSLVIHCSNEKDMRLLYKKLSQGGEQTQPLQITFWDAWAGELIDRYGNNWMLYCNKRIHSM